MHALIILPTLEDHTPTGVCPQGAPRELLGRWRYIHSRHDQGGWYEIASNTGQRMRNQGVPFQAQRRLVGHST